MDDGPFFVGWFHGSVCVHKARCKGMVIESVERMAWDPWGFGKVNGSDDYLQTGSLFS